MQIFPIGWEVPERKSYRAGWEDWQPIVVHGQRSEGLILHHQPLKPLKWYTIKVQVSEVTSIWFNGTMCYNLKEKMECSNSIHDGKNWHQICISRSGERQKICRIVSMKIRGNILCSGELGSLYCRWNACHQNLEMIDEMKHLPGASIWKPFTIVLFAVQRQPVVCCLCLVTAV